MDYDSLRTERDDIVRDGAAFEAYRAPGDLINSNHPKILSYARQVAGEGSDRDKALRFCHSDGRTQEQRINQAVDRRLSANRQNPGTARSR